VTCDGAESGRQNYSDLTKRCSDFFHTRKTGVETAFLNWELVIGGGCGDWARQDRPISDQADEL